MTQKVQGSTQPMLNLRALTVHALLPIAVIAFVVYVFRLIQNTNAAIISKYDFVEIDKIIANSFILYNSSIQMIVQNHPLFTKRLLEVWGCWWSNSMIQTTIHNNLLFNERIIVIMWYCWRDYGSTVINHLYHAIVNVSLLLFHAMQPITCVSWSLLVQFGWFHKTIVGYQLLLQCIVLKTSLQCFRVVIAQINSSTHASVLLFYIVQPIAYAAYCLLIRFGLFHKKIVEYQFKLYYFMLKTLLLLSQAVVVQIKNTTVKNVQFQTSLSYNEIGIELTLLTCCYAWYHVHHMKRIEIWCNETAIQLTKRSQRSLNHCIESIRMNSSSLGKAVVLVNRLVEQIQQYNYSQPLMSLFNAHDNPLIEPFLIDEMVDFAKMFIETHSMFKLRGYEGIELLVDIGYHYTSSQCLDSIRKFGLLSKTERNKSNIATHKYNGSTYGDGIYTANDPLSSSGYGDVGLMVARLHGRRIVHGTTPNNTIPTISQSYKIANKTTTPLREYDTVTLTNSSYRSGIAILRTSSQCLPIVKYDRKLIDVGTGTFASVSMSASTLSFNPASSSSSQSNSATATIKSSSFNLDELQTKLQKILDDFFVS